ncbi:MAG: hypothetical protein GXX83_10395, partial [Gaiellales bacterium]|nr:hypothetical protein [Gaiellales bacterium]
MRSTKAGLPRHMRALVTLTVVGYVMFGLMAAQAGATTGRAPAGKSAVPGVALSAPVSGREAIDSLDTALPSVAEAHGISATELSERLLWDRALTVDRDGRLFYLDPAPEAGDPAVADAAAGAFSFANTPASLADTFLLHSLPGANRVIYLDFDGHVLSGCAWNSYNSGADIVCPPFDIDGAPETFSNEERVRIQEIWQRVAEDYAPFAVDVTTAFPGEDRITRSSSADRVYGMRVLISPLSQYMGNYGGIAYVNVFDFVGDYYKPALVFPENLGPNGSKYVAEAASHENGHTLGLYHDGTTSGVEYYSGHGSGDTGWAPIMGSGYYKNLTQWSKGEYSLANNKEDDLAILSTSSHIPYRADDHGGSISAASALAGSGQLSASGVIGRTRDVDFFSVSSGAGTLSVSAAPLAVGSNLDIKLELRNSRGAVVASSNPTDLLTASLSKTVAGGTFYVAVSGTGRGNPLTGYSNYGSLGAYSLALNVPASGSNQAPTAAMTATPTSGTAPLTVSFDGTASVDPDGSIVSYA